MKLRDKRIRTFEKIEKELEEIGDALYKLSGDISGILYDMKLTKEAPERKAREKENKRIVKLVKKILKDNKEWQKETGNEPRTGAGEPNNENKRN